MGSKWKVKMSSAGARDVLSDGSVQEELDRRADAIASSANARAGSDDMRNPPFSASSGTGSPRAAAFVGTSSPHGVRHNSKHNTLLGSLGAGRG